MTNSDEVKEKFYEGVDSLIIAVPKSDILLALGDFSAHVGKDHKPGMDSQGNVEGGNVIAVVCSFSEPATLHELLITNTSLPTTQL